MNNEQGGREAAAFRDLARPGSARAPAQRAPSGILRERNLHSQIPLLRTEEHSGLALDWALPPNRSSLLRLHLLFARCWTTTWKQTER